MPAKPKTKPKDVKAEPRIRIHVGRRIIFGPGKADLLERIESTGSIGEAAKAMGMSYMKAWKLVRGTERGFAEPLVHKRRGGNARGGAALSKTGRRVLELYREMETASRESVRATSVRLGKLLAP
jgi:molybdate transport system regulatory protein